MVVTGVLTVVLAGLRYTGVLQWILKYVFGLPGSFPKALLRMMIPVSVTSAFINNTTVTALFSDIVKQWARKLGMAASKLYIPLVYAVLMGGVCTPIGAPANMMVYGPGGYRFSDFMRIGIPLTLIIIFTGIVAACLTFPLTPLQ